MSAASKVLWPAPHAFTDETGTSIGYNDNVVFPLRVVPQASRQAGDAAPQARLCGVREAVRAGRRQAPNLTLPGGKRAAMRRSPRAEARVPKLVTRSGKPGLTARRVNDRPPKPLVIVDLVAPTGEAGADFRRRAAPEWALPVPSRGGSAARATSISASSSTGCRPASIPKGPFDLTFTRGRRRRSRSRSRPISTNPPGRANLSPHQKLNNPTAREDTHAHQGRRQIAQRHVPRHDGEGPSRKPPTTFSRARRSRCSRCPAPSRRPAPTCTCRAL